MRVPDGGRANRGVPSGLVLATIDSMDRVSSDGPCAWAHTSERTIEIMHDLVVHSVVVSVVVSDKEHKGGHRA